MLSGPIIAGLVTPWSPEERTGILDYCQSDIRSLEFLLEAMLLNIELPYALHRGQFSKCIARMEHTGLPIDVDLFRLIREQGPNIREALIADYESAHQFGIYEDASFRMSGFEDFLLRERIAWPRLASGLLATSDKVFKERAAAHPKVAKLRELRWALTGLRDFKMAVGDDSRNRTLLGPFGTITSRNAPKAGQFLFGAAAWQRARAFLSGEIRTPFGWKMQVNDETKATTIQNWPVQSCGAEMMRVGIEMLQAKGVTVCCPVHDAVIIESELADFDDVVEVAKQTMADASQIVMNGQLTCRVDAASVRWPDRYQDKRPEAIEMWTRATRLLGVHQCTPTGALTLPRVITNK